MASTPITLGVGEVVYELGARDLGSPNLDTRDDRVKLAHFLRAVADTLDDGYTLRKNPQSGGTADGD